MRTLALSYFPSFQTKTIKILIFLLLLPSGVFYNLLEVNISVIIEGVSNINKQDIKNIVPDVNQKLLEMSQDQSKIEDPDYTKVKVQIVSDINPGTGPFKTLQRSCDMIKNGISAIVSLSSCSTTIPLTYMTKSMEIPHIVLPSISSCPKINATTNEIKLSPKYDAVYDLISLVAQKRSWTELTVFYDEFFHEKMVLEISDRIKMSMRKNPVAKGRKSQSDSIKVRSEKIFDPTREAGYTKARLKELQLLGQSTEFIILASEENTLKLLDLAETVGFSGEYFHWIIGNYDIQPSVLFRVSNSSNVISILRENAILSFEPESANLILNRTKFGRHPSVFIDYIRDSVLATAIAIGESLAYEPQNDISTKSYRLGCLSDPAKKFLAGPEIQNAFQTLAENPLKGTSGIFSLRYNENEKDKVSLEVNPNLVLLSNGPYWSLIYRYESITGLWKNSTPIEDMTGGFFPPKANTLKGLTLRIVTIEEEPFIIRTKRSMTNGDIWSGYCIDILEAIRRHNSIDSPFDYEIYPVSELFFFVHHQWDFTF